jgi:hypothetical protein
MIKPIDQPSFRFDGRAHYRIVVGGSIPDSWKDRLAGMLIVTSDEEQIRGFTVLQGEITDQSELNGILETLYRLQLTIISVEQQLT